MYQKTIKRFNGIFLSLLFLAAMAGSAGAVTFSLTADATTLTMPDGTVVPMWGFALGSGPAQVPGPPLVVPPGDTTVTITLTNNLPEPVSLNILGQMLQPAGGPVWTTGTSESVAFSGNRTAGDTTARVRSFAHETPPGGTVDYTWNNFKAGSYLLMSGTNPAKQVQMGLYAAITKDAATGLAYQDDPATAGNENVAYSKEVTLVYSEIDPEMHDAIVGGYYGANPTAAPPIGKVAIPSSLNRTPKYFLINGKAFNAASPSGGGLDPVNFATAVLPGDDVLVRFLNAGYTTHVPQLLNMYMSLVAEDGTPHAYRKEHYGIQLPAGKTVDAILTPTAAGRFPLYDAALNLTNNGAPDPGGMLSYFTVLGAAVADADGDGIVDTFDNCTTFANADQRDTDADGYGNRCDTDLDNSGLTNFADFGLFQSQYLSVGPDADFDGNNIVNFADFGIFQSFYLQPPGPSGLVP